MIREDGIIYVNFISLRNMANAGFGGDRERAKGWLRQKYKGRTIRFTDIWRAA